MHGQEDAVVGLVVDQHVVQGGPAGQAPVDLGRAAVLVAPDPEDPLRVRRPAEVAGAVLNRVADHLARGDVPDVDAVHLGALLVDGPGVAGVVGAVAGRGHLVIGLALGQGLHVQQHLFAAVAPAAGPAHVQWVLGAGVEADEVVERAVRHGRGGVVLLDPALHLLEQLGLQRLGRGHHRRGVGVLRLQVRADLRLQRLGVEQHLAPVVVAQPGVVVGAHLAVLDDPLGLLAGDGGDRRLRLDVHDALPLTHADQRFNRVADGG